MRRTTTSPVFVGSPTSVAIRIPFGKAGLSFHASASGVTLVKACCAIAELANAIKAAATKDVFMLTSSPIGRGVPDQTTRAGYPMFGAWKGPQPYPISRFRPKKNFQRQTDPLAAPGFPCADLISSL